MVRNIRRRLGIKIFLSYLVIILVGIIVLAVSSEFTVPSAFENHMSIMTGDSIMGMGMMGDMMGDLYTSYRYAVNEALTRAALAAFIAAVVVSVFISRKVVAPVREIMTASQRIAEGNYKQRVQIPSGTGDDLDELDQLALSFNRMAEKLAQTEGMRRQLIGDISHELRTPLTAIQGSMEGLMDGVLPASEDTYQAVYREANRLTRLVDDLQELSRVEAGAVPLDLKPLDISSLITSVTQRLRPQFEGKDVSLEVEIPSQPLPVLGDEDRLAQVLINLVGNALQYTQTGGQVHVAAQRKGDEAWVTVRDNGIGIPAEHLPHLFSRFYRVDKSRSRAGGGSGIGLTIARYLVEAHNGKIWAESPGDMQGSVFTLTLPILPFTD